MSSYQVFARRCRPKQFSQIVGQEIVVRTLIRALDQNRLHHAYLFSGMRGVGKTTLARILAKCFNCELGVVSAPCGVCSHCTDIGQGIHPDCYEIDAASRTKVEDTRDLLDGMIYAPIRGRFKIYLIDEVHMLSGHSFNALLKTLEEPPEYIKFLLATTDPKKLPATIVSRCLQLNLNPVPTAQIASYLASVLTQEQVTYADSSLHDLAEASEGSVRDALNFLDQCVAYGQNHIDAAHVKSLLGHVESRFLFELMEALNERNGFKIIQCIQIMQDQGVDFSKALNRLMILLHHLCLLNIVPDAPLAFEQPQRVQQLARQYTKEEAQLFYQIGLIGQKNLSYAPTPRLGFEMTILRMLSRAPHNTQDLKNQQTSNPSTLSLLSDPKAWAACVAQLPLSGMALSLAVHGVVHQIDGHQLNLILAKKHAVFANPRTQLALEHALSKEFKHTVSLHVSFQEQIAEDHMPITHQRAQKKHDAAQDMRTAQQDASVQKLIQEYGARIIQVRKI